MLKRLMIPAVLATIAGLFPAPALAQVNVSVNLPGLEIRVGHSAPPPVRYEHRASCPGPGYVWLGGAWDWQGNDWAWMPGRWDRPVAHDVQWTHARYHREHDAWRYEPAHWSNQHLHEGDEYRQWRSDQEVHQSHKHHHDNDQQDHRKDHHHDGD